MTNKELVLKTIEYLKPKSGHTDVVNSLWKELGLNSEKKSQLRDVLLKSELINLGSDQWTMKLTAKAILLTPDELNEDGSIVQEIIIREQKTRIDELQIENLSLQNAQLKNKTKNDIVWFFAGFLSSLVLLYLGIYITGNKSQSQKQIELKIEIPQKNLDTTFVIKSDSIK